ncbi:MAG: hypothetical protein RL095_74 [Verrucomicrobiota bacterium]|jgi:uncharacterized membrane protein
MASRLLQFAFILLMLLYPLIVWLGLSHFQQKGEGNVTIVASILLAIVSLRFLVMKTRSDALITMLPFMLSALFLAASALTNEETWMLMQPAMINLAMFIAFALSLRHPPCVAERLARLEDPKLPPEGVIYCRKVTRAWCKFFIANGTCAAVSAFMHFQVWVFYNGFVAYILIGLFFVVEMFLRRRVKARIAAKRAKGEL